MNSTAPEHEITKCWAMDVVPRLNNNHPSDSCTIFQRYGFFGTLRAADFHPLPQHCSHPFLIPRKASHVSPGIIIGEKVCGCFRNYKAFAEETRDMCFDWPLFSVYSRSDGGSGRPEKTASQCSLRNIGNGPIQILTKAGTNVKSPRFSRISEIEPCI